MKRTILCVLSFVANFFFAQEIKPKSVQQEQLKVTKSSYRIDSSSVIAKYPLKNIENPQVYHVLPKELIKDQVNTNFNTVLQNITGVALVRNNNGLPGNGASFYTLRGFAVQPTLVNGMPHLNNSSIEPHNIESVEVLKGNSSTLFGSAMSAHGGLINITTKKPEANNVTEIGALFGGNQLNRYTLDVNRKINQMVSARIVAAYHTENSFQDAGFNRYIFVAPSVKVSVNERLTVYANAEIRNATSAQAPQLFLSRFTPSSFSLGLFEKNYTRSFTANPLTLKTPSINFQAQGDYKIDENWTSQTKVSFSNTKSDGYGQFLWNMSSGNNFTRYISRVQGNTTTLDLQQNFLREFKVYKFKNRLVAGVDFFNTNVTNQGTPWVTNGVVSFQNGTDTGILFPEDFDAMLQDLPRGDSKGQITSAAVYVNDVIDFLPNLTGTVSFRLDHLQTKSAFSDRRTNSQTVFSPKLGVVYQPMKEKIYVFVNFMNGMSALTPLSTAMMDGSTPRVNIYNPERATQLELGAKANLYQNKVSLVASLYHSKVSQKTLMDPNNPNNFLQGAKVNSNGVEFSVISNPMDGLQLIAGYSHNASEITKDIQNGGYKGLRPEEAGPKNLLNFWAKYQLNYSFLKGITVALGGNYAGEHRALNRSTGHFTLPSYLLLNSVISYSAKKYSVNLRLENITNQKYYTGWGTITPQNPRTIALGFVFGM